MKSESCLLHPKYSWYSKELLFFNCSMSYRNPLKGATPVPGPIIITPGISALPSYSSLGSLKSDFLINPRITCPVASALNILFRKPEARPYQTSPVVRLTEVRLIAISTEPGRARLLEAIV